MEIPGLISTSETAYFNSRTDPPSGANSISGVNPDSVTGVNCDSQVNSSRRKADFESTPESESAPELISNMESESSNSRGHKQTSKGIIAETS